MSTPHSQHGTAKDGAHEHEQDGHAMPGLFGPYPISRESSGTAWQPQSTPMTGMHWMKDGWSLMLHGMAQAVYANQGGKRGDDEFFSNNMLMFMAGRDAGPGRFGFRAMLSAEPFTMDDSGYPNLLATGETADGRTVLIDRQHPHDLFMEFSASYRYNLSDNSSVFAYFGYPGEPALGPPTFMHRFSGMEFPEAPITHHWLDSTHITFGVATVGYVWKNLKFDTSVFTGREPDHKRADFDQPRFDSYAFRISYNPTPNWSMQASYGLIESPEQLEPDLNTDRLTISIMHQRNWRGMKWGSTVAFGQNRNDPGRNLNAVLAESTLLFMPQHTLMARAEWSEKDELFDESSPNHGRKFGVGKVGLGYIYDFFNHDHQPARFGLGVYGTASLVPDSLDRFYGQTPLSFSVFARVRF